MGFPQSESEVAIQAFGTVQAALEALLAGKGEWNTVRTHVMASLLLWPLICGSYKILRSHGYVLST